MTLSIALAALSAGALAMVSEGQSRASLLAALQRPATTAAPAVPRSGRTISGRAGRYRVQLRIGPNRASVHNALSVRITERGRPVDDARLSVAFSMPSMNMWHVFTSRAVSTGSGSYAADVPIVGMSGRWQLRVRIARASAPAAGVNFTDRMGA